jgi:hypothetical protein
VARAATSGVDVTCKVEWDYPPHEAIVRRAARIGAELIIAECHEGSRLKPWLMHLTDWELLRTSAVPVLLFKNTKAYQRPAILAAVDPSHQHAKPARLDSEIVARAEQIGRLARWVAACDACELSAGVRTHAWRSGDRHGESRGNL